jgi:hypothetical protein
MALLNTQKTTKYYDQHKESSVVFSKEIIEITGLITKQVYLKCMGNLWPCVIYSTSFQEAKVVVTTNADLIQKLQLANNAVSLRFCFKGAKAGEVVPFFVTARSLGYIPYGGSKSMTLINLQFIQRPPDDLINIMGRYLDARTISMARREQRIVITSESQRKLNFVSREVDVSIHESTGDVKKHCVVLDISCAGAGFVMLGQPEQLQQKEVTLYLDFVDPEEHFLLRGKCVRVGVSMERQELVNIGIAFDEESVPMRYKMRLNDYITKTQGMSKPEQKSVEAVE